MKQSATIRLLTSPLTFTKTISVRGRGILFRKTLRLLPALVFHHIKLVLLSALTILLAALQLPAYAPAPDDLYRLFQMDLPSADIVFLLDASRSMIRHQYSDVRQAAIDFAPTLTDKDNLHLRIFGDTVSNPLEGNGSEIAPNIDRYLPQEPVFTHTDLGLAILKGLEFIERDGASQVQAFFLITDGLHQPPQDSPFSRDFANDPEWQELKQRAYALCNQHTVIVYGFGIGQQTDISILRQVFPAKNVEMIVGGPAHISDTLSRVRQRLSRAQLRRSIEQEIDEGMVEVLLPKSSIIEEADGFDLPITVRNGYKHLPIRIEKIEAHPEFNSSKEISCELEGDWANALLEPSQQWHGKIKGTLRARAPSLRIGKAQQVFHSTFSLVPVVRFYNEASLDELGISSRHPRTNTRSLTVELRTSYGISYWSLTVLILTLAVGSAIALTKLKRAKQRREEIRQREAARKCIVGKVKIWPAGQTEPEDYALDLSEYRAENIYLVIANGGELEVTTEDTPLGEVVAQLSGHLIGASPDDEKSWKSEFHIEAVGDHSFSYESDGQMVEAASLVLCAGDLLEIDARWRLRYVNYRLRTRAEVESAQIEGEYHVE